jgi:deoxyribonuclease-4
MRRLGVHTSIAGGLPEGLRRARELGCNTVQIFSHSPRSWALRDIPPEEAREFRALRERLGLNPVFVHACYLINLTSASADVREKSIRMLGDELRRADAIGADFLVLHAGAAHGLEEEEARTLFCASIRSALAKMRLKAGLLIENTASGIASRIEDIGRVVRESGAAGLCLDSCHAFGAGYDVASAAGLENLAGEIERHVGIERLRLVHLNDSKGALGSGVDRHEHIGMGRIGMDGMRRLLGFGPFRRAPLILETPKKAPGDDPRNLSVVRGLLKQSRS